MKRAIISEELRKILRRAGASVLLLTYVSVALVTYLAAPKAALGQGKESSKSPPTKSAPDPCGLLSSTEIERVQGETLVEKKYFQQAGQSFLLRECFYRTATFTKSVSVALAVPNAAGDGEGPREYWKKHFRDVGTSPDGQLPGVRRPHTKEELAEQEIKPVAVSGLGEQAYWIADPHVGTLYVLQENYFLRISLGGKDGNDVRSNKAKDLARAALRRLKPARAAGLLRNQLPGSEIPFAISESSAASRAGKSESAQTDTILGEM